MFKIFVKGFDEYYSSEDGEPMRYPDYETADAETTLMDLRGYAKKDDCVIEPIEREKS